MTNQQLVEKLTALAEKAGAFGGPVDLDAQNLLRRELVNNLPEILAAMTARSDGWREGVEVAAKAVKNVGKEDDRWVVGSYLKERIATAIRALTPPETTP